MTILKNATIEQDVVKLRPRIVKQEREALYDDVLKQRITTNQLKAVNTQLQTRLYMIENELARKDKVIDDLVQQE